MLCAEWCCRPRWNLYEKRILKVTAFKRIPPLLKQYVHFIVSLRFCFHSILLCSAVFIKRTRAHLSLKSVPGSLRLLITWLHLRKGCSDDTFLGEESVFLFVFFKVFFAICRTGEAEMVTNTCVLIVKRMMIAMTEVMQAVKPQWHLQLLLNYHCWGWQHTSDRFIIHFAPVTSNQHPEIFFLLFFPPCSLDWFLSTLSPFSPFHISWCIICVIASVCKWRKLWWQFQFGRNSEST